MSRAVFLRAAEILAEPKAWTKKALTRDAQGRELRAGCMNPDAASFCMLSALAKATVEIKGYDASLPLEGLARALQTIGVSKSAPASWQDAPERTHAEVLALLHRAAELSA